MLVKIGSNWNNSSFSCKKSLAVDMEFFLFWIDDSKGCVTLFWSSFLKSQLFVVELSVICCRGALAFWNKGLLLQLQHFDSWSQQGRVVLVLSFRIYKYTLWKRAQLIFGFQEFSQKEEKSLLNLYPAQAGL